MWAVCGGMWTGAFRETVRQDTENTGDEGTAGESPGAFAAPGRSLPPAVRAVEGNEGWRFSRKPKLRLTLIF